jgi:hypothetical protein
LEPVFFLGIKCDTWKQNWKKAPTPEEAAGLDPNLTPVRFWIMRTARFLFPGLVSLWIDIRKARQNSKKQDQ